MHRGGQRERVRERESAGEKKAGSGTVVESCQLGFGLTDVRTGRRIGRPAVVLEVESILRLFARLSIYPKAACRVAHTHTHAQYIRYIYVLVRIQ